MFEGGGGVVRTLSDEELQALPGPQLLERTRDLVEVINQAQAELSRTGRVADSTQAFAAEGMKTAQSWLRAHTRLAPAVAAQVVRNGRAMAQLPAVAAAHAAGSITAGQVSQIGRLTAPRYAALAAAQGVDLAEVAATMARFAAVRPHEELVRLVHTVCDWLDADGPEP